MRNFIKIILYALTLESIVGARDEIITQGVILPKEIFNQIREGQSIIELKNILMPAMNLSQIIKYKLSEEEELWVILGFELNTKTMMNKGVHVFSIYLNKQQVKKAKYKKYTSSEDISAFIKKYREPYRKYNPKEYYYVSSNSNNLNIQEQLMIHGANNWNPPKNQQNLNDVANKYYKLQLEKENKEKK